MNNNNDWPFGEQDEFLAKFTSKSDVNTEEIFEEEDILTTIRLKSEAFGAFFSTQPKLIKNMIRYCFNDFPEGEIHANKLIKYTFYSSEIFSYELEDLIELFFKETTPSHIENLKSENDEVLLEEIQLKEEEIPDEKSEIGFKKNAETQENEVEKKMNEMNIVGDIGGSINMDEAIDMSKTVKKPSKLQWNVDNLELLDFFFSYLEKKPYLINSTSLGYFFKIANALLNKKFDHLMYYLEKNSKILNNGLKFLKYGSISDFFSRLLRLDNPNLLDDYEKPIPLFLNLRFDLIKQMTQIFNDSQNSEEIHNIASILREFIYKAKRVNGSKKILEEFNKSCAVVFFEKIDDKNVFTCSKAFSIIESLLSHFLNKELSLQSLNFVNCSKSIEMNCCMDILNEEEQKLENINNTNLPELLCKILPKIISYLKEETQDHNCDLTSTFGTKFSPFGPGKLQFTSIIKLCYLIEDNEKLGAFLSEENIIEILMNYMIKYEWNNILHQEIFELINTIVESKNIDYKKSLFEKFDILTFIIKFMVVEDYVMPNKHQRKLTRGYIGFLTKICNNIIKKSEDDVFIKHKIQQNEKFIDFQENYLKKLNNKNNNPLAGFDPRDSNLENSYDFMNEGDNNFFKINDIKTNEYINNNMINDRMPPLVLRNSPTSKDKFKNANIRPKEAGENNNFFDDFDIKE